jgi:NRPS condensation-like uncharacterized protein
MVSSATGINGESAIPLKMPITTPDLIGYMANKRSGGDSDRQVRMIVRFRGTLDEVRLAAAVRMAFDAEPVAGCRLVERPFRPYWRRCPPADLERAFEFHRILPGEEEAKGMYGYLLEPLDPYSGPQVRAALFRSDSDTLYIRMSHLIADGGAATDYLRLLSGIYRRLGERPDYRPASNLRGSRTAFQVLRHAGLLKALSSCTRVSPSGAGWMFPCETGGDVSPAIFIRRIGRERASRIKSYAKRRGATVGDALLAASYRALFTVIDPPHGVPMPVLVSVNLRRYLPGGRGGSLCSLTAGYFPKIARRSEPFESTLSRVRDTMAMKKAGHEELGQALLAELVLSPGYAVARLIGPYISPFIYIPTFSNIGVIEPGIADFGIPLEEVLPAGPMHCPPGFVFGSSTFNGEMSFASIVCGTEAFKAKVNAFFEALVRELPE